MQTEVGFPFTANDLTMESKQLSVCTETHIALVAGHDQPRSTVRHSERRMWEVIVSIGHWSVRLELTIAHMQWQDAPPFTARKVVKQRTAFGPVQRTAPKRAII